MKAPNPKFQAPEKTRVPNSNTDRRLTLGAWNLFGALSRGLESFRWLCACGVLFQFVSTAPAQVSAPATSGNTNKVYLIDLPTVLRLANAQNLDIQIARERLKEAKAYHASAVEQFLPWISPGAAYRRHENRIQDVGGNILDADQQP